MSRLAAILMFIAWFLYGAMPAMAVPYSPMHPAATASPMLDHAQHHAQREGNAGTVSAHSHSERQQPRCLQGGKSCGTPFCAACLILLPQIATSDDSPFRHSKPPPTPVQALTFPAPEPLKPPPRA
jgi:hypothetical protein